MEKETQAQARTDSFLFKTQRRNQSNLQLISASTNLMPHTHSSVDHILYVTAAKSCLFFVHTSIFYGLSH